ncbi:hypothetical protein SNE25_20275 [Mucilaginibacter sabulilitoris]|uniref:Uncharacterized protein n=1 Tax=Mucilaginibacter sabulilitoris TaxID=1173583 RepID=A0ABZ0THI6_9SPHI|nr:hypothetical protein [Mucilaginibacter sabulilitoris]WPU91658.1 hypothetical protein SNE25_20275 [Mucilaginibacter sabulilitoris]
MVEKLKVPVDRNRKDTIVLMISIGKRSHLTNCTYQRMHHWANRHGYQAMLITKSISDSPMAPHFNKLIAHRAAPGFKRYIIVDDDILLKTDAPAMEDVPEGLIGLVPDANQSCTQAKHVQWTANTGFIVAGSEALHLLEQAFRNGEYPYSCWDGSNRGIWGPHDQAALNDVVFKENAVYKLDWRWNYQAVVDFYGRGEGWETWANKKCYRLGYYISLLLPSGVNRKLINSCFGLHMTMGVYPRFFSHIHR